VSIKTHLRTIQLAGEGNRRPKTDGFVDEKNGMHKVFDTPRRVERRANTGHGTGYEKTSLFHQKKKKKKSRTNAPRPNCPSASEKVQ